MRTRSFSNLLGESSPNLTSSNSKRRNRRRSKQPFILGEFPVDTIADQRTMTKLLRAPTEGYAEAIVVPSILAEQFGLKHSLINMMTSGQFFGLEKNNPHDHIRWFNKITSTIKYKDVPNSAIKLMLFPFSLAGAARRWLKKEPPHSLSLGRILFQNSSMNSFPPQERQISVMKFLTFNNADQDSLNSVAGGNLFERRTQDVLTIIENKSKVRNSRNKSIVSQVNTNDANSSSSSEIAKLTHAVNQQTSATGRALIDVHKGELTLRIGNEAIAYNLDQTMRNSTNYNQMTANKIDVIEMACEEYSQEVLGFSDVTTSGNPTPHDDPISSKCVKPKLLNDEPPDVEFKDLPPHLEYAFLEGDNKLPVIITKELGDEEKSTLIKVLKSHKQAIAWKLSDIQVHCVPKKGGFTVVENEENELIPTRLVIRWRDFSKISRPMTHLLEKNNLFIFSEDCIKAFQTLKKKLKEAPILIAPNWDLPFELMCDASNFAIGAVLGQRHEKHFKPIHYASKTMNDAKSNYDVSSSDAKARLLRWVLLLQEFNFKVLDTKGAENLAVDHLSRLENPYENVLDPKGINETFPLETLSMVTFRGDFSAPWFADFANYLEGFTTFILKLPKSFGLMGGFEVREKL
nr:reverse transcriptase domain-containing protein [Tanacetum cinerariifolium]